MQEQDKNGGTGFVDTNYYDLLNFSGMPEGSKLLLHKNEEFKLLYKKEIDAYEKRRMAHKRELCPWLVDGFGAKGKKKKKGKGKKVVDGVVGAYPPIYWFELTLFRPEPPDWSITLLDPWPEPQQFYYDVLSEEVLGEIGSVPVDRHALHEKRMDVTDGEKRKTIFVRFVRLSSNHVVGTVQEEVGDFDGCLDGARALEILENGDIPAHWILYFYFHHFPHLREEFINKFNRELLPTFVEGPK